MLPALAYCPTWNFARRIVERGDRKDHVVWVASRGPISAGGSLSLRSRPFWTRQAVLRRLRVANNQMKRQSDRSDLMVVALICLKVVQLVRRHRLVATTA